MATEAFVELLESGSEHMFMYKNPLECFNEIISAYKECEKVAQQERTKRREITAWEKTKIAEIQAKRDLVMGYLDRSFDERAENFRCLFEVVDRAITTGDNQQLALTLNSITELAQSSPFKDLASLSSVKAALEDPNHVWEF